VVSSSPPAGGRKARLAAERLEREARQGNETTTQGTVLPPHSSEQSPYATGQTPYVAPASLAPQSYPTQSPPTSQSPYAASEPSYAAPYAGQGYSDQTQAGQSYAGETQAGQSYAGETQAGQSYAGETQVGQSYSGETQVGQSYSAQQYSEQQYTAQPQPAQPYVAETYAGQSYAGETQVGQSYAGQQYSDQTQAGQSYAGQQYPSQPQAAPPVAGQQYSDQTQVGQAFAGQPYVAPAAPQPPFEAHDNFFAAAPTGSQAQYSETLPTRGGRRAVPAPAELLAVGAPGNSATGSMNLAAQPGPSTTELEIGGSQAGEPPASGGRFNSKLGQAVSNRRVWGGVLALALVLVVPGVALIKNDVKGAELSLTGDSRNADALQELPDATASDKPNGTATSDTTSPATAAARAKAKAKAAAGQIALTAAKVTGDGTPRAKTKDAKKPTAGSTGRLNSGLSGLPWVSGVFPAGAGTAGVQAFGDWRGSDVDVVIDWSPRQSWNDVINPDWTYSQWKGTPYTKVFGVAMLPEGEGDATMAGCAAGSYNDKWREFGTNIRNAGLDGESVIRLGWEFNGDWYKWQAGNPDEFAECWRQIVGSAESTAPALLWDWNPIRGAGKSVVDPRKAWPGDSYVDIVGVDAYDMWPGATDEASWAEQYSGAYGLKFWSDFAKDHGKKISVPEWGLYPTNTASTGGDNAFFISKMQGFFKEEGSHLAYESYFNEKAAYIASSLFGPEQNPIAAARYKSLFGS
jgi:hypothetical protein